MPENINQYDQRDEQPPRKPKYKTLPILLKVVFVFAFALAANGVLPKWLTIFLTCTFCSLFAYSEFRKHREEFTKPQYWIRIVSVIALFFFVSIIIYFHYNTPQQSMDSQSLFTLTTPVPSNRGNLIAKSIDSNQRALPIADSSRPKKKQSKHIPVVPDPTPQENYDLRSSDNHGVIIGKNNGTILQNPHVTIDPSGISIDSNSIIQNNRVVATAKAPQYNLKDSTLIFWEIHHTGAYNGTKDFLYRGIKLHPISTESNSLVGFGDIRSIVEYKTVCTYTGTINGITRK